MLKWILDEAHLLIEIVSGIVALAWGWWKWKGKKWYIHYTGNRNAWRTMMLDVQKNTNVKAKQLSDEIQELRKNFYPNGGSSLMDKVNLNTERIVKIEGTLDVLIDGQRSTREMLGVMHWESDRNGKVVYVSYSLCELLGCTQEQVLGNSWIGLILQEDRRRVIENWKQSVENASFFKEQFTFKGCDDEKVLVKAMAIHNKDKNQGLISSLVKFQRI